MQLLSLPLIIKCIIRDLCYREERLEQTFDCYASVVNDNIKVNKDGHGLKRLWQQQLMQFPLVALETSQAIASINPLSFNSGKPCQIVQ